MGGLRVWKRGRQRAQEQQGHPEGGRQAGGTWRSGGIPCGFSLFLLVCLASTAYSQQLTLTPSLIVEERYDDNFSQSSRRSSDTRDFVTRLTPGIRVQYLSTEPTPDTRLDFDYQAAIDLFADHSNQNQVGHRVSLILASQLARSLSARVRELLVVTDDPFLRQERLGDPTGFRQISAQQRNRTIHNELGANVDVGLGARTSLGVRFENLIDDVSTPEELDEFRYTVGTEFGYLVDVARESRVLLAYQVSFHTFRDNANVVVAPQNNSAPFQAHVISTGFRHHLTPSLATRIALGYTFTTSNDPINDGQGAFYTDAGLTKTFKAGEASLGYIRQLLSGQGGGRVVLVNTLRGAASIDLTGKLTARVDGNLSWSDFQGITNDNEDQLFGSIRPGLTYNVRQRWSVSVAYALERTHYQDNARADITDHQLRIGTQFALNDWLSLGLVYRYTTRQLQGNNTVNVNNDVADFSRNQIGLTISASPNIRF